MSDKSPLFVSSLELLAHATELYASGQSKKFKFVILHLANSIELILKDCLVDHGTSIYKNPKETITIWGSFDELAKLKITIPEKPIIELLIDDRNTIQHRFGFPNAESVFYYLEQVVAFFSRFLDEQYEVKLPEALSQYLSEDDLALIGLVQDDYSHLRKLYRLSPEAAIQQAYAMVELKLRDLVQIDRFNNSTRPSLSTDYIHFLVEQGRVSPELMKFVDRFRRVRNLSAHGSAEEISKAEFDEILNTAFMVLDILDKLEPITETGVEQSSKSEAG